MIRVTCAIIFKNHRVLVVQRGPQMKLPLMWEFPGGKVENGETDEECIKRELAEELGISIDVIGKMNESEYDYGDIRITLIPFLAMQISGEVTLTEHAKYEWLSQDELKDRNWAPADVAIVEELLKTRSQGSWSNY